MKKFVLALLAVVLVLGLSTVAFAADCEAQHNFAGDGVNTFTKVVGRIAPTCTEDAKYVLECVNGTCTATTTVPAANLGTVAAADKALNHDWTEWTPAGSDVCDSTNHEYRICRRCEEKEVNELPYSGHNYKKVTTPATCLADGVHTYTCTKCGDVYTEKIDNPGKDYVHNFDLTKGATIWEEKEVTCYEGGYTIIKCADCAERTVKNYAAKNHKKADGTSALSAIQGWVGEPADCTEGGIALRTCSECNKTIKTEEKALGHDWSTWQVTKAANCTETGFRVRDCLRKGCQDEISNLPAQQQEVLPALGHDATLIVTKAANCTEAGTKQGGCARCATIVTETIDPLGHKMGEWKVEATYRTRACTVEGCKYFEVEAIAPVDPETPADPEDKPSTGDDDDNTSEGGSSSTGSGSDASIPATGDNTSNAPYIMMVAAVAGLVVLVASKRKVNC